MDWEKAAVSDRGYNKAGLPTRAVVRGLEGLPVSASARHDGSQGRGYK